jgi:hypothetical protein
VKIVRVNRYLVVLLSWHCALLVGRRLSSPQSAGHQQGVKGTAAGGGEDKERSGTGAALTPQRPALNEKEPSAGRSA